ncbi:hypothetical protein [Roseovarius sp. D0-M9]|uniref:hypothetical protein n=1 Tax=Roseovarius sp. D0-M9 TaxID=3127117 RepID=UPI0030100046
MSIPTLRHHVLIATTMIAFLALPGALSAQTYAPPDPDTAAQEPLPEHDPEAQLRGKTALEHAEDLAEPVMMRRLMALQALIDMATDALPARDMVRFTVEHNGSGAFSDAQIDELKLGALSALYAMRAPETEDLVRSAIIDPDFVTRDKFYSGLLEAATQMGVDHATLTRDVTSILDTAPDHAVRLMALNGLPGPVQVALEQAVFDAPHGEVATLHFLDRLGDMSFLDDESRIAYVIDNRQAAGVDPEASLDALAEIGTEAALDAAIAIGPSDGLPRAHLVASFAKGPLPSETVMERLLEEAQAAEGDRQIGLVVAVLERTLREDATLFARAMTQLIEDGPTDAHRSVGIARQVLYLRRNADADAAAALRPVFAVLNDTDASREAKIAADKSLRQSVTRIAAMAPDYFIAESVALIWPAQTPSEAEVPMALLRPLMSSDDLAPRVVTAIGDRFHDHLTDWAINPATAIAIASGTTRGLERSPTREAAAIMMGKAIESPAIDLEYLGTHLARNGAALASLDQNTVAGVIGTYVPTIFAQDKPESYDFAMEPYLRPMLERPRWLQQDAEALAEWTAFLQRVVDLDDENFSPTARRALDGFR